MKKHDVLVAASALLFTILFYEQAAGINYLIFTLIYGLVNISINKINLSKRWYFAFIINFLTALNIFIVHTDLSVFAWYFSFIVTIGKAFELKNTFLLNLYVSFASPISAFEKIYKRYFHREKTDSKGNKLIYLAALFISFVLILLFFFLYKGANPLFSDFTNKINFDWLDLPLVFFTLFGFFLLFTLVNPYIDLKLTSWDTDKNIEELQEDQEQETDIKKFITIIAISVFFCLNLMLLLLNSLDINSLFIMEKLPSNIFISDFLHFAVTCIVVSIILAIALIFGIQQFKIKNKLIKTLIYAWIAQNLMMVFNTSIRNYWYSLNQITYLRIGVFVFLFLSIIGLIYTAKSIYSKRNYWYNMNLNFQTWFYMIIFCSFFPWDRIITKHNLSYKKVEEIDLAYLNSLSTNNVDLMLEFYHKNPTLFDEYGYYRCTLKDELLAKKRTFLWKIKNSTWQSFNLMDKQILKKIRKSKQNVRKIKKKSTKNQHNRSLEGINKR